MKFIDYSNVRKKVILIVLAIISPVCAAKNPVGIGEDKYNVTIGYFLPAVNTKLRVDSATLGRGTSIDLEDDLGLDEDQNTGQFNAYVRLAKRHRLGLGYFRLNRSASGVIDKTIQYGDLTFDIDTEVSASLNNDIIFFNYMYSIYQKQDSELALALGLHYMNTESSLSTSGGAISGNTKADAPLPVIGVDYKLAATPKLHLGVLAQWFQVESGDFEGSIRNIKTTAEYFVQNNVAIGVGYNDFDVKLDASATNFRGAFEWRYKGFQIFTSMRF